MTSAAVQFHDAVAARCELAADIVRDVLTRKKVVATPSPPKARTLRLVRINFKGEKTLEGAKIPFEFDWNVDDGGLWGIASEDNLAGKTSIIQVALWALRGDYKDLAKTVRDWIGNVEVTCRIDEREIKISFAIEEGEPVGSVEIKGVSLPLSFSSEEEFKQVMQDVMLENLALEPISASRTAADGRVVSYFDGWLAYTGAFISDSNSDAIIGQNIGGADLTQRLLQVFVGVPWAATLFQARANVRELEGEAQQRKRRLSGLGGKSVPDLEKELQQVIDLIDDETARNNVAKQLVDAQRALVEGNRVLELRTDQLKFASDAVGEAKEARIRAERTLLALDEDQAAAKFFGQLEPVCCPRCLAKITSEKLKKEKAERHCSVCTTEVPKADDKEFNALRAEYQSRVDDAKRLEKHADKARKSAQSEWDAAQEARADAAKKVRHLSDVQGVVDVNMLEVRRARLEGMLEVTRAVIGEDLTDGEAMEVLKAAVEEAGSRTGEAAKQVLERASDEVCRIVNKLGMKDVEKVEIKRNANVTVHKGGGTSSFSSLSVGEQLRMRIATVVALVRSSHEYQMGRHPGLLFIDSPGKEEMKDVNLEDMLQEIKNLTTDTPGLQIFVAMRGIENASKVIDSKRLRVAKAGQYLW